MSKFGKGNEPKVPVSYASMAVQFEWVD